MTELETLDKLSEDAAEQGMQLVLKVINDADVADHVHLAAMVNTYAIITGGIEALVDDMGDAMKMAYQLRKRQIFTDAKAQLQMHEVLDKVGFKQ